jgi:hypothetical protein
VQKDFYAHLAAEMIDNGYDTVTLALGRSPSSLDDEDKSDMNCRSTAAPRCGVSVLKLPVL